MPRIAFLVAPPLYAFDLAIAQMVFDAAGGYEIAIGTPVPGMVATVGGPDMQVTGGLDVASCADTLVVMGGGGGPVDPRLLDVLRGTDARRVAAICTGTFVLARAGLLDGRRATTHWELNDELARRFPAVTVERDAIYVEDGRFVTSAGAAACVELCLHIVRADHGAAAAARAARMAVAGPLRPGDQGQLVVKPLPPADPPALAATLAWALGRLDEPLTLADLAAHARMSARTLTRRFHDETGMSPLQWLLHQRVERACELLETTSLSMDHVAHRSGLGTADSLRLHLFRRIGTTPTAYRAAHRSRAS